MTARAAGRQKAFQGFREKPERRLVALMNHQVGKGGGDFGGENIF